MYRCFGCDHPAQSGCAAWCAAYSEQVELGNVKPGERDTRINIASGEDVALWIEEMELN